MQGDPRWPAVRAVMVAGDEDVTAVLSLLYRLVGIPLQVTGSVAEAVGSAGFASLGPDDLLLLECSGGAGRVLGDWLGLPHEAPTQACVTIVHPRGEVLGRMVRPGGRPVTRWLVPDFAVLSELEWLRLHLALARGRAGRAAAVATAAADLSGLSPREHEVVTLVAEGRTNSAIADELDLSPGTVKTYVARGMEKLGQRNRQQLREAVRRASEGGDPALRAVPRPRRAGDDGVYAADGAPAGG